MKIGERLKSFFASQIERCKGKFNPAVQPSSTMEIKPNEIVQESKSTKKWNDIS